MAYGVKRLLCKHTDLNSVPRNHTQRPGYCGVCLLLSAERGRDRKVPGCHWFASLAIGEFGAKVGESRG